MSREKVWAARWVEPACMHAHALYSDLRRTGSLTTSDERVNQLISNIEWSQRGEVPLCLLTGGADARRKRGPEAREAPAPSPPRECVPARRECIRQGPFLP